MPGLTRRSLLGVAAGMAGGAPALAQDRVIEVPLVPTVTGLPEGLSVARTGKGLPAAWRAAPGDVRGGYVLIQTSADQTDYRFPLAIYDPVRAANLDVSVRFRAISGRVDRAGGIAVRLRDPDNYYVVRANALEDNVNFYRVVRGVRHEIKGATVKVPSDAWHTLGLSAEGEHFTVSFNGTTLFTATDRALPEAGHAALWTKADSVTEFTAIRLVVRT